MNSSTANVQKTTDRFSPLVSVRSGRNLSLVIPAYNEEAVILQAITEAAAALESFTGTFEILVIDDGSTDATASIVENYAGVDPRVRLIQHPQNIGYGAALRTGYSHARGDLVAMTDADCQFDLNDLDYLCSLAERFDIVSGYRIDRQDSVLRKFCSRGYNTLVQLLMGSPVRDIDCALKVFRRDALRCILPDDRQFFANTEMFSRATDAGLKIVDVGVRHRQRAAGQSKVRLNDVPRTLNALLPYWWNLHFGSRARHDAPAKDWSFAAGSVVLAVAALMLFCQLGYPLIDPDEGRYAEIMREMSATGDWTIPRLMGEAYLDKPPLFYWLGAFMVRLFGPEDWAVRLVPAASAWLTVLLTFWFGKRLVGLSAAFLGSMILTLSIGFNICGRFLILDSLLTLCVTGAILTGLEALRSPAALRPGLWRFSAIACGLGVLTKGPVALVLTAPPLLAHAWLTRNRAGVQLRTWLEYLGIIAAINLPWYVWISIQLPGFLYYFFWEHNVARFMSGSNHPGPMVFYVPVLLLGLMPWGLLLFPLTWFLCDRSEQSRSRREPAVGCIALAAVWCLVFFSIASAKLPAYILPAIPLIAMLLGHYLEHVLSPFSMEDKTRHAVRWLYSHSTIALGLCGVIFPVVLWQLRLETLAQATWHSLLWLGVLGLGLVMRRRISAVVTWGVYCCVAAMACHEAVHDLFPSWAKRRAVLTETSPLLAEMADPESVVASLNDSDGSIPFYLRRTDVVKVFSWDIDRLRLLFASEEPVYLVADVDTDMTQVEHALPKGRSLQLAGGSPGGNVLKVVGQVDVSQLQPILPVAAVKQDQRTAAVSTLGATDTIK